MMSALELDIYAVLRECCKDEDAFGVAKQALDEYRDSVKQNRSPQQAQFQELFKRSRAITLLIDSHSGRLIDVNPAAVRFYGYDYETLCEMHIQELSQFSDDDFFAAMRRAQREKHILFEAKHKTASGEIREVDVYCDPLVMDGQQYLYTIIFDVTNKRQVEARYRALFEQSNDAMFILGLHGEHLAVNRQAADMLGYTIEELESLTFQDVSLQGQEDIAKLLNGETLTLVERVFLGKGGTHIPVELNIELVRDDDDTPRHIQTIVRDITDRKAAQEQAVEKERLHILGEFIQNTGHEFKTPLSVIETSLYLLIQNDEPPKQEYYTERINRQVKRLSHLVDQLLKIVVLNSGDLLSFSEVAVGVLLVDLSHIGDPHITWNIAPGLPPVQGDYDNLYDAFYELLENARRFSPPGSPITVAANLDEEGVIIDIIDQGFGISEEDLPHIFKSFWRKDKAHTSPGIGLGLPLAKHIIESHEGRIEVFSQENHGSRFRVYLPAS